jgi:hypothetical protein
MLRSYAGKKSKYMCHSPMDKSLRSDHCDNLKSHSKSRQTCQEAISLLDNLRTHSSASYKKENYYGIKHAQITKFNKTKEIKTHRVKYVE